MHPPDPRATPRRATSALPTLLLAIALCSACTEQAPPAGTPRSADTQPADRDGPGRYYLFRTLPHEPRTATPEQVQRCNAAFGPRGPLAPVQTNALEFSIGVDAATGLVSGETARYLGPGFICAVPGASPDFNEAYAYASIPGVGEAEARGSCALLPQARAQAVFVNCQLDLDPRPDLRMLGGFAVSNTVSGSIFAAYVVPEAGATIPRGSLPPRIPDEEIGALPNDPDFWVFRSFDETAEDPAGDCAQIAGADVLVTGVRKLRLSATQPDLDSARLDPQEPLRDSAALTLCFVRSLPLPLQPPTPTPLPYPLATGGGGEAAIARIELIRQGQRIQVTASGYCRNHATPAGADWLQQACSLGVSGASEAVISGGLLTSIGLVSVAAPQTVANSHLWALSLLPPTAPPESGGGSGLLCAPGSLPALGGQCAPVDPTAGGP